MNKKLQISLLKNPVHFLALGFGSGLVPKAPGTFGTLAAIPIYLLIANLDIGLYLLLTLVVSLVGIYICDRSSKLLGVHDHPGIVWDEIAGFLITMIAVPFDWLWILIGFGLFRFFDIIKPQPIGYLDKNINGGLGIMVDDILAGVMACLSLHLIMLLLSYV